MNVPVKKQVVFIKAVRNKYGLSADKLCDIVSNSGVYVSINTVRRIIAKESEHRNWRAETVTPLYEALYSLYGEVTTPAPKYAFPNYNQDQYEKLIQIYKGNAELAQREISRCHATIEKQREIIEILWHGLQCSEDYEAVVNKYIEEGGVIHG